MLSSRKRNHLKKLKWYQFSIYRYWLALMNLNEFYNYAKSKYKSVFYLSKLPNHRISNKMYCKQIKLIYQIILNRNIEIPSDFAYLIVCFLTLFRRIKKRTCNQKKSIEIIKKARTHNTPKKIALSNKTEQASKTNPQIVVMPLLLLYI
jgi:hypothetical protein